MKISNDKKNNNVILGIDIGGSHITTAILDVENKVLLEESLFRNRVNSQGELSEIIDVWTKTIQSTAAFGKGKKIKLGIAMPGPCNYEEGISLIKGQHKFDALYGLNIKSLLAKSLNISVDDVLMLNDASCFLQGEAFSGVAKSYKKSISVTLGTGLGTSKHSLMVASDANLWNMPFKDSIAEDYISTRWFIKRFYEISGIKVENAYQIVLLADENPKVKDLFDEFGSNLGEFLVDFISAENPEVVVLGGSIAKSHKLFIEPLRKVLKAANCDIPVLPTVLGENAAIIGAACLWLNQDLATCEV